MAIRRTGVWLALLALGSTVVGCGDDGADDGATADAGVDAGGEPEVELGDPVVMDWECNNPDLDCGGIECPTSYARGPLTLPGFENQAFIVDYPCDLREREKVTFVLNVHGGGSFANWQRHYFPAKDFVEEHRLIVLQPQALPQPSSTRWLNDGSDDAYIKGLIAFVDEKFGSKVEIDRFWVVGHSNGGLYGKVIACWPELADRITGHVNLSGTSTTFDGFGVACDINFLFSRGEDEATLVAPDPNPVAERMGCDAREGPEAIVDTEAGQLYDNSGRVDRPGWGGMPGPGTTEFFEYPSCDAGLVVADYVRLEKGHTEGYEPNVTAHILEQMLAAPQP
jgi:pimeloyl-ACP methyl ester carboxylesterase